MVPEESALEHKTRKLVFNFILSNPGVSFGTLKKMLDLNASTLKYHLNYLEKNDLISSKKEGKKRCYYCSDRPSIDLSLETEVNVLELPEKQQRILEIVRKRPGVIQKKIIKLTKFNQKTVSYNLNKMIELRLIWKIRQGGETGYELITKEAIKEEIINRLIVKLYRNEIDPQTFKEMMERLESLENRNR